MKEIKSLKNIDDAVKSSKQLAIVALFVALISVVAGITGVVLAFKEVRTPQIYEVSDYNIKRIVNKEDQVIGHIKMFYRKFFEIDQYNYKRSIEEALNLIGESGLILKNGYEKDNWYNNLVTLNISIGVDFDSIRVNMKTYPYKAEVFSKMVIHQPKGGQLIRNLNSVMEVSDVHNSEKNPFGLLIDKFVITDNSNYVPPKKSF